jgi:ribose-phosphate pyrophosphokinase
MDCCRVPAVQRLKDAPIAEVVITDSVVVTEEKRFDRLRVLSVGELLAKAIRFTHSEQSVIESL